MQINKELVLRLYERKDPKRRRILFEYYRGLFDQLCSIRFLIEIINQDLGKSVIVFYDIKYIRANAVKWTADANAMSGLLTTVELSPGSHPDPTGNEKSDG